MEARQIGLDLLQATARFDEPLGVKRGVGGVDLALIAFAARGRRLLRAAYRLLDAAEPDAATPLLRIMSEYLIVGRWLLKVGEEGLGHWAIDDLRRRLATLHEVVSTGFGSVGEDDERLRLLNAEIANTETAIRSYGGPQAALSRNAARKAAEPSIPGLQGMAHEVGLGFAYSFAYRTQSHADVHATPLAIDATFDDNPDEPGPRLRAIPRHALSGFDLYAVGAHLLLDILEPVTEATPEFDWKQDLESIAKRLQTANSSLGLKGY